MAKKKNKKQKETQEKILLEDTEHSVKKAAKKRIAKASKPLTRPLSILLKVLGVFAALSLLGLASLFVMFGQDLPDITKLKEIDFNETTVIYDREGNILYSIFGEENRQYVPLGKISLQAIQATLAIEDKNFYSHMGFDIIGIVRAQIRNIEEDDIRQGASTITQQLAKNIFLTPERTYERKIKELLISMQIELLFEKDEILEMYLNKIAYGTNSYGIEAAAQTYFGKSSSELTLVESAILAALPKAPSYFSPHGQNRDELMGYCKMDGDDPATILPGDEPLVPSEEELAGESAENGGAAPVVTESNCSSPDDNYVKGRKDHVLDRMLEDQYITEEEYIVAWKEGLSIAFRDPVHKIEAPHFVFYVRELLEEKYGKEMVESGGFQVITSLDPQLQSKAEDIVASRREENMNRFQANNAALVAVDPKTGQVLAMVGSVDYWNQDIDGQVNVTTSPRQPGSSFKPMVYANAIENGGIGSGTTLSDNRTVFENNYIPRNSDDEYKGSMVVRTALAHSRNIPAIKAYYIGGEEERLLDTMDKMGVRNLRKFKSEFNEKSTERGWTFHYGPAMAIGSGEVPLLELVAGYGTLANKGKHMPTNPILEIRDRDGNVIEVPKEDGIQAVHEQTAYIVSNILSDPAARPGGSWRAGLTIEGHTVAAKTGTSNKKVGKINYPNNLLTIGYSPSIAAGAWVGNSDGSPLSNKAWGLTAAGPIWKEFMTYVLEGSPDEPFVEPEGIVYEGDELFPGFVVEEKKYDKIFVEAEEDDEDEEGESEIDYGFGGPPVDGFGGDGFGSEEVELASESEGGAVEPAAPAETVDVPTAAPATDSGSTNFGF